MRRQRHIAKATARIIKPARVSDSADFECTRLIVQDSTAVAPRDPHGYEIVIRDQGVVSSAIDLRFSLGIEKNHRTTEGYEYRSLPASRAVSARLQEVNAFVQAGRPSFESQGPSVARSLQGAQNQPPSTAPNSCTSKTVGDRSCPQCLQREQHRL